MIMKLLSRSKIRSMMRSGQPLSTYPDPSLKCKAVVQFVHWDHRVSILVLGRHRGCQLWTIRLLANSSLYAHHRNIILPHYHQHVVNKNLVHSALHKQVQGDRANINLICNKTQCSACRFKCNRFQYKPAVVVTISTLLGDPVQLVLGSSPASALKARRLIMQAWPQLFKQVIWKWAPRLVTEVHSTATITIQ